MLSSAQNIDIYTKYPKYIIANKKLGFKKINMIHFDLTSYDIVFAAKKKYADSNITEEIQKNHCS